MREKIVILADGCFDPIHEGHIKHLIYSSELGTYLVVNTNPDYVIWEKRPLIGPFLAENERKMYLKSFPFVDKVLSMPSIDALREIKPDVYTQGADWKGVLPSNEIEICEKLSIKIKFTNFKINSSTKILNRFINQLNKTS